MHKVEIRSWAVERALTRRGCEEGAYSTETRVKSWYQLCAG